MNDQKTRTFGAAFVLVQGLVTALFPQISIRFIKRMIGKNFDNASELEATPAYLRQLRAIGIGMTAAAGTHLLLQSFQETADRPAETGDADAEDDHEPVGEDEDEDEAEQKDG